MTKRPQNHVDDDATVRNLSTQEPIEKILASWEEFIEEDIASDLVTLEKRVMEKF